MKRREFLTAGGVAAAALTTVTALEASEVQPLNIFRPRRLAVERAREYVEVRKYTVKDAEKREKLIGILDKALIPALNRQRLKPVGVFAPLEGDIVPRNEKEKNALTVFVVIPHTTAATFVSANAKLLADSIYRKDAAPIFETNSKDPVYTNCDTFFLYNFPTIPVLENPSLGADRIFQLRLYRSFNIERNAAKIKMFDQGGEMPLFRKVGLNPIFFGDVIAGTRLPALLYMFGCPSVEARNTSWKNFVESPEWKEISRQPEYADTATEIENFFLKPSPVSQI